MSAMNPSLTFLDCAASDCVSAHGYLGFEARAQIQKTLARRLTEASHPAGVDVRLRRARQFGAALQAKMNHPALDETLRTALAVYQACLRAWASTAKLDQFRHPWLAEVLDGVPVSGEELAFILQEDEVGCQTGAYRERDGSLLLWHAEEDVETEPGERFDQLRLFSFRASQGATATAFIYPDLLPGPAFGWQGADYAQAVDTLHVRPLELTGALLPNTLAWLSLYLGPQVSRAELARQLGPFAGGYSLTTVSHQTGLAQVEKVEFANAQVAVTDLGPAAGGWLFQTNILRDLSQPIGAEELTSPESRAWNETRQKRTARLLRVIQRAPEAQPLIFRLLRSRLGGESAYANRDVKAHFVCRLAPEKLSVWVGSGPARAGAPLFFTENQSAASD
jgi:hypothetical protein